MNLNEINSKTKEITSHYGMPSSIRKLIEECNELISEAEQTVQRRSEFIAEMADVTNVIEGLIENMGCRKEFEDQREYKVVRQLQRINNKEKQNAITT